MSSLRPSDSTITRAGNWFLKSGIQQMNGGVARYYRSDVGKSARVSTEITGYAASALIYLGERTGNSEFINAGIRAARFLTSSAWNTALGTFPFEHSDNCDQPEALAFFFDCGIIVRGLLEAWCANREQRFLDIAIQAGRSMIADFRGRNAIHPILRLPEKQPLPYEPKWSASPGCYQLKSALAWHELFKITGDDRFEAAFKEALVSALETEEMFLPGEADRQKVMDRLHAYCYFLEALLPFSARVEVAGALSEGIARATKYFDEIAPEFERSDVCAQLLRVRLCASVRAGVPLDEARAAEGARRIARFQLSSTDARIDGGFAFGCKGDEMLPFVNPVSTAFCAQALALWSDCGNGTLSSRPHSLI